ncbi:hypothetical protein ACN5PE_07570 [Aliarcobacter butzleri]
MIVPECTFIVPLFTTELAIKEEYFSLEIFPRFSIDAFESPLKE